MEAEARRRAMAGSDLLLIFLLKGLKPEKYRERHDVTGKKSGPFRLLVKYVNTPDPLE